MKVKLYGMVTYNVWRENTDARVHADLTYLMGRNDVDIIALQEAAKFAGLISKMTREDPTWSMTRYDGQSRAGHQNVVLWRKRTVGVKTIRFIDLPESSRAAPDRRLVRVRAEFIGTGRQVVLFDSHMHSHVENKAWWNLPRQLDFRKHLRIISRYVETTPTSRAVLAVADWNTNLASKFVQSVWFFPPRVFKRVGMRSNWEILGFRGGTHHKRVLDAWFLRTCSWMKFRDQQIIKLSSDHHAVLVRVSVSY